MARAYRQAVPRAGSLTGGASALFEDEIVDGVKRVAKGMGTDLYSGAGGATDQIIGLETAVAAMGGTGLRFAVSLRSETDSRFVPILEESGLILAESAIPAMVMQPIPDHQMPTELEILSGSTTLEDHIYVASKGFGIPEEMLETVLVTAVARRPDATFYAGYVDDQPVSTSIGFLHEGSVSVFNVATLEDLRGRGYGAAMTMKAVIDARDQGCEVAFLQSSELGYTVYTRLGFATIFTYDLWGLPPVR